MLRRILITIATVLVMTALANPATAASKSCQISERAYTISSGDSPSLYGAVTIRNRSTKWQFAEVDFMISDPRGKSLFASGTTTGAIPPRSERTLVYDNSLGPLYRGDQKVTLKQKCSIINEKVGIVTAEGQVTTDEFGSSSTVFVLNNQTRLPVSDWSRIHVAVRDSVGRLVSGCWGFPDQVIPPGMQIADGSIYCSDSAFAPPDYRLVATVAASRQ